MDCLPNDEIWNTYGHSGTINSFILDKTARNHALQRSAVLETLSRPLSRDILGSNEHSGFCSCMTNKAFCLEMLSLNGICAFCVLSVQAERAIALSVCLHMPHGMLQATSSTAGC